MQNTRLNEASPVLSVLAVQGGRVTGKTAKERPKRDRRNAVLTTISAKPGMSPVLTRSWKIVCRKHRHSCINNGTEMKTFRKGSNIEKNSGSASDRAEAAC